jgi:hypothetical protein
MQLQRQQCILHPERGAVARCPQCQRFYCHECITEHDGEVLCRHCLNAQCEQNDTRSFAWHRKAFNSLVMKPLLALACLLLLWMMFLTLGSLLLRFPDSFHTEKSTASTPEKLTPDE